MLGHRVSVARAGKHGQVGTSLGGCKEKSREGAKMGGCKSESVKKQEGTRAGMQVQEASRVRGCKGERA